MGGDICRRVKGREEERGRPVKQWRRDGGGGTTETGPSQARLFDRKWLWGKVWAIEVPGDLVDIQNKRLTFSPRRPSLP